RIARPNRGRPAQILHTRRTKAARPRNQVADEQPHEEGAGVPAAGDQPAVDGEARRVGIEVHRLWVILPRKPDDVPLADLHVAEIDQLADAEVLVVAGQRRNVRSSWSR